MNKFIAPFSILLSSWCFSQTLCVNGFAGLYECKNIDLLSLVLPEDLGAEEKDGVRLNDLWGWTDPQDGKEYGIIGMVNGTAFLDVSDPLNPVFLGKLVEHNNIQLPENKVPFPKPQHLGAKSIWRDIKVYNNHAYIVSEDPLHGMQVFDLTLLRDRDEVPKDFTETGHYDGFGNAHNIVINEETGYAYGVGATGKELDQPCTEGGLHMVNLEDPANPRFAGCFDDDGYTHDAQVVIYTGPDEFHKGKEIAFNSNENTFTIVDVSDKESPLLLSRTGYDRVEYLHQGWLTEDQRFFLSNDERDEERHNFNTRTAIWDVTDLDNPKNTGFYFSDKKSIDHNLYLKERYAYQSNYTAGLRVLNASTVEDSVLSEAGYFDTFPLHDLVEFAGTWSNYPYFKSGIVLVSDDNGLFILKPNLDVSIDLEPEDLVLCDTSSSIKFSTESEEEGVVYQWQNNSTGYFENIPDGEVFSGATTKELSLAGYDDSFHNIAFRCLITSTDNRFSYSNEARLIFDLETVVSFSTSEENGVYEFINTGDKKGNVSWDLGQGDAISNEDTVSFVFSEAGEYKVKLTVENDCGSLTSEENVLAVTGLKSLSFSDKIKVFPSPTVGVVTVSLSDVPFGKTSILVYDNIGRLILSKDVVNYSELTEVKLDLTPFAKGTYLVSVKGEKTQGLREKVIKY